MSDEEAAATSGVDAGDGGEPQYAEDDEGGAAYEDDDGDAHAHAHAHEHAQQEGGEEEEEGEQERQHYGDGDAAAAEAEGEQQYADDGAATGDATARTDDAADADAYADADADADADAYGEQQHHAHDEEEGGATGDESGAAGDATDADASGADASGVHGGDADADADAGAADMTDDGADVGLSPGPGDTPAVVDRERLVELYREAVEEHERIVLRNQQLQKKLKEHIDNKRADDGGSGAAAAAAAASAQGERYNAEELEARYQTLLSQFVELRDDLEGKRQWYDERAVQEQDQLREREAKAAEMRESFAQLRRELAFLVAQHSRTGRKIPSEDIQSFETQELHKDTEIEKVRLLHIQLRNQCTQLEAELKQREELKGGLHLIDFEQLKIENQTYNEKIEERTEEIQKLRKKIHMTVQVLTHVKEKMQFVQEQNQRLKRQLEEVEHAAVSERDTLARTKLQRDALRAATQKLQQQSAMMGSDALLHDFDDRDDRIGKLENELQELRERYEQVEHDMRDRRSRVASHERMLQSQASALYT